MLSRTLCGVCSHPKRPWQPPRSLTNIPQQPSGSGIWWNSCLLSNVCDINSGCRFFLLYPFSTKEKQVKVLTFRSFYWREKMLIYYPTESCINVPILSHKFWFSSHCSCDYQLIAMWYQYWLQDTHLLMLKAKVAHSWSPSGHCLWVIWRQRTVKIKRLRGWRWKCLPVHTDTAYSEAHRRCLLSVASWLQSQCPGELQDHCTVLLLNRCLVLAM